MYIEIELDENEDYYQVVINDELVCFGYNGDIIDNNFKDIYKQVYIDYISEVILDKIIKHGENNET